MLPIPFANYIPKFFTRDDKLLALSNKTDTHLSEWREDVLSLNTMIDPVRMPEIILDDVGYYLNAGIFNTDSSRTKRQKIWNAIQTHRFRGTWRFDVKPSIDSITGGDAILIGGADNSDFIILGGESDDPDVYWATMGADGIDDDLGIDLVGAGDEPLLTGLFQIDINAPVTPNRLKCTSDGIVKCTSDGLEKGLYELDVIGLKETLADKIPDYYRVILGTSATGEFVPFADGQIN